MINKFNLLFLTCLYIGKAKYAPGTLASLVTCIFFFITINILGEFVLLFFTLFIFFYSLFAINLSFDKFNSKDPQEIVVDEVVGQMLPLLAIPIYETLYLAPIEFYCFFSFLLFRLFDIWKPYPINYIDNNTVGALGIMMDDVLAGFFTIISLIIIFFFLGG